MIIDDNNDTLCGNFNKLNLYYEYYNQTLFS